MHFLSQIGILPALLITLGGLLVRLSATAAEAERRYFLYLLGVGWQTPAHHESPRSNGTHNEFTRRRGRQTKTLVLVSLDCGAGCDRA